MSELKSKFSIGDSVYSCDVNWSQKHIPCPDCLGTGEWKVICPSGEEFQHGCNTCYGGFSGSSGKVSLYEDQAFIKNVTIGSIQYDSNDSDGNFFRYMCIETGVGTGRVYYEKNLFHTEEEAKEYGQKEVERVKGFRQQEELKKQQSDKKRSIYKPRKMKSK